MNNPTHTWTTPALYPRPNSPPNRRPSYAAIASTTPAAPAPYVRHNFLAEDDSQMDTKPPSSSADEPFITPSYLRGSRHIQRLRDWREEQQRARNSGATPAGKSQAHKPTAPEPLSHAPPPDSPLPLPTHWSPTDRAPGLEILGPSHTELRFSGVTKNSDEAASIRSNAPIPPACGLYYFEITLTSRLRDGLVGIGFSSAKTALNRLPGWEPESWAYHGDDGYSFACTANGKAYGPRFASQDVVGAGVNMRTGEGWFTKNGVFLGVAFQGLGRCGGGLWPSVGIKKPGEGLRANFGGERFVFDVDALVARERGGARGEVGGADVRNLYPPHGEEGLVRGLVSQWLAHEGFVETSRAFAQDLRGRRAGLGDSVGGEGEVEEDVQAVHRQRIRRAILEGDVDRAMKYLGTYYPGVLAEERNRDVYFRLRCRKFVEMMRRWGEEEGGTSKADEDDGEDVEMTTSTASLKDGASGNELLEKALRYGQELQVEFGNDPRPSVKSELSDVFAIMAYTNPKESVVGGLLDVSGRVGIAEGVNGAVLVSLGKPSSAALEKVCAQTQVLLDAAAAKPGNASAFVNVKEDFLTL